MMRYAMMLTAALLALGLAASPASAQRMLLDQADAEELAATLAEAQEEQDVCYGWQIEISDEDGPDGMEAGSSVDPNRPLNTAGCAKYAVLHGTINWTSDWSEVYSSSDAEVKCNFEGCPKMKQIKMLTDRDGGSLSDESDREDAHVISMTETLPLLVAENGAAPSVPAEEQATPIPASDAPTGSPASDFWRNHWWKVLLAVLTIGGGLFIAACGAAEDPYSRRSSW